MKARRTKLYIEYENKDISTEIDQYLIDFTYSDNEEEADDLQITLEDKKSLWLEEWFPEKFARLKAEIHTINYDYEGHKQILDCGTLEIDEINASGPPSIVKIKATSIPNFSSANKEKKSKAWENTTFKRILNEIASNNGLGTFLDVEIDKEYKRINQSNESDLSFLKRLAKDLGYGLKVYNLEIIIFDNKKYNNAASIRTITKGEVSLKTYNISDSSLEAFKEAQVSYKDAKTGKTKKTTSTNSKNNNTNRKLKINTRAESKSDAHKKGSKVLEDKNKETNKASFTLAGDISLACKQNIEINGWGRLDGKYSINKATHSVSGSGYITSIDTNKI